jgi:hypothetical protein
MYTLKLNISFVEIIVLDVDDMLGLEAYIPIITPKETEKVVVEEEETEKGVEEEETTIEGQNSQTFNSYVGVYLNGMDTTFKGMENNMKNSIDSSFFKGIKGIFNWIGSLFINKQEETTVSGTKEE